MPAEYGLDSLCHAGINGKHDQGEICNYPVCCDTHVSLQAQNNHVKNNVYGDRVQELPQVKSVTVNSIQEDKYTYNDNEYEAYKVDTSWEYEKDMGYDTSGVFYLIKDNNKLNVVEKQEE